MNHFFQNKIVEQLEQHKEILMLMNLIEKCR